MTGPDAAPGGRPGAIRERTDRESEPSGQRLVFLGGLHRSGTSLLFQCLREHPSVSGLSGTGVPEDEGQHIQPVYPTAMAHGGPGRFGFEPEAHLTEASPLASDENRGRILEAWRPYWDAEKPCLLEKSPPNLLQTRFLQALFPEASFVVLLRHPVAVSYATRKWSKTPMFSLLRHWLRCHELFEQDRPRLSRVLVLKYETFVREPDATLASVYGFLGLPPHPASLAISPHVNRKYFQRWLRGRDSILLRPYVRFLTRRFEERVSRFGYSLEDLERV